MSVASLRLCKELYELSGWGVELDAWRSWKRADVKYPLYDLSFLLRKFKEPVILRTYQDLDGWLLWGYGVNVQAPSPEDAAAKLAIKLFKRGILNK